MSQINRRQFVSRASVIAGAGALASVGGCQPKNASSNLDFPRFHPLDGVARQNIKITDVKVIPLSYVDPNKNLWRSAQYVVWKADGAITQIYTDAGIVGIGEGTPYEGPDHIKEYTEKEIKPLLLGRNPFDVELYTNRGDDSRRSRAPWAGVDCALWDVIGKAVEKPVYELLATQNEPRTRIPIYASSGVEHEWYDNGGEFLVNQALQHQADGYDCMKIRKGTDWDHSGMTLEKYIDVLASVREAVGPDFRLCQEAMGKTDTPFERILSEFCPALEELGFYWFEEAPGGTVFEDIDWYLKLQEALPTVLVTGGERFRTRFETQVWLDQGALDIVQSDCNVTGITENWYIAQMAHQRGIMSIPHNWHGGGTTMANALFTAAIPNGSYCELNQTYNPLKEEIFKEPLTVEDGWMELPDKPGYGVELIDDVEKRFPFVPGSYLMENPRIR